MKLKLDISSVQSVNELHQKDMQSSFLIFGFVAGVVKKFTEKNRGIFNECNFQSVKK